jgi:hypothetical protein
VVAPDLGAFPERLSDRHWTWICPWYWLSEQWVQFFEGLLERHFDPGAGPTPAPRRPTHTPTYSYRRDYLQDLRQPALAPTLPDGFLQAHSTTENP